MVYGYRSFYEFKFVTYHNLVEVTCQIFPLHYEMPRSTGSAAIFQRINTRQYSVRYAWILLGTLVYSNVLLFCLSGRVDMSTLFNSEERLSSQVGNIKVYMSKIPGIYCVKGHKRITKRLNILKVKGRKCQENRDVICTYHAFLIQNATY